MLIAAAVATVIAVLVAAGLWGRASADAAAEEFSTEARAWQDDELASMVDHGTVMPDGLFADEKPWSAAALKRQKTQCAALDEAAEDLDTSIEAPELSPQVFGFLSGTYRDVSSATNHLQADVTDLQTSVVESVDQARLDCRFSLRHHQLLAKGQAALRRAEDHELAPGASFTIGSTQIYCTAGDVVCIPPRERGLGDFVREHRAYVATMKSVAKAASSPACRATSLGKDSCAALAEEFRVQAAGHARWIDVVDRSNGNDEAGWNRAAKRADAAYEKAATAFGEAIVADHPELEGMPYLTDPWPTEVFRDVMGGRTADLQEELSEIKYDLSGRAARGDAV